MGTRFLLTSDAPVADDVKRVYFDATVRDTVVTSKVDGVPHRVLRSPLVDALESAGRVRGLLWAVRNGAQFKRLTGLTWGAMLREGGRMKHGRELTWAQVLMAANTPMLLKAAMVDGRTDLGIMASGQVVGLIDDLP
jgi:NAD(P)H-dependent flavin oxidoreductase YrpB (nitropropane dioxygenase family)